MTATAPMDELLDVAEAMADAARLESLRYFRTDGLKADNKAGEGAFDPVTLGDRAAEVAMREVLASRRPADGIVGEEFGRQEGSSGLTWVLDPIDGTRAFLCGTASWGVLISLEDDTGPVLSIIDQPYTRERFIGVPGQFAELRRDGASRPLTTRRGVDLQNALLLTTFPEIGTGSERNAFEQVHDRVRLTRYGLDCYGYALLALGQVDLVIEAGLSAYDISAPVGVIQAAGGIVTDWEGGPVHGGGRALAAGCPELHKVALELLNRV